jgi:hypothetical protein
MARIKAALRRLQGKRLFEWLNRLPWTKPIAILYAVSFLVMEFLGWLTGRDLPPNLTQMGIWFGGAVFTLATGKSIVEKNLGHTEPLDTKGEDDGRNDKA